MKEALSARLSDRAIFIFSLAISKAQRSPIPVGFFRRALDHLGLDADNLELSDEERLLEEFGTVLGQDAHALSDALWEKLAGRFDQTVLVDLTAFAGLMVATTLFANVVRAEPDDDLVAFLEPTS
ncbi:hypothetical protein [Aureimonas endophytica]|uniref:hypothetical protein n=1 Tax=Aureimonas endophytica TaxID=2027858 RepID=UPI001FCF1227|nr:hypothetical protein [Aureimonas endophytica]